MLLFELVLALLLGGALLTAIARKIGAPYPVLLALAGTGLALAPFDVPGIRFDPDLALTLFVAPVILDAAFDASPRDLRENWIPVSSLVLVAVALTVAAVALVARHLVPDMPWAVAIALGAIVAPPDPVSATAVLGPLSPPRRLMVILEGEGLLNDASALLIYRYAVGVALGTALTAANAVPLFLANSVGSLLLGWVLARLYMLLTRRITDLAIAVVTQFVATFVVWIAAEKLGVSPVLTLVTYAVVLARLAPGHLGAENRRGSYAVWEVAVYVLNALAFILIGLQLQEIGRSIDGGFAPYAWFGLAILATVIVVRLAWTFVYNAVARLVQRADGAGGAADAGGAQLQERPRGRLVRHARPADARHRPGASRSRGRHDLPAPRPRHRRGLLGRARHAGDPRLDARPAHALAQPLRRRPLRARARVRAPGSDPCGPARARRRRRARSRDPAEGVQRRAAGRGAARAPSQGVRQAPHEGDRGRTRTAVQNLRRTREIGDDAYRALEEELDWAEGNARRRGRPAPLLEQSQDET